MTALAVTVVDHRIEDREPPQPRIVRVDQQGRLPLPDLGEGDGLPALAGLLLLDEREKRGPTVRGGLVVLRRRFDPQLAHALAVRPVPQHGGRYEPHPVAWEISYAATSRWASVPSGKSHRGCSPATGLYTHVTSSPSWVTVQ